MKYILMMHHRGPGEYAISSWSRQDLEAHLEYWQRLNKDLLTSGELVGVEALAAPPMAKVVRADSNGMPAITDGPFAESKEFLAGYWIVDVESERRAHEIAARASAAPGPGGTPLIIPIEVRQVMRAPMPDV